jgi:hypothetical protein
MFNLMDSKFSMSKLGFEVFNKIFHVFHVQFHGLRWLI